MRCETCDKIVERYFEAVNHLEKGHLLSVEDREDVDGIDIQAKLNKESREAQ